MSSVDIGDLVKLANIVAEIAFYYGANTFSQRKKNIETQYNLGLKLSDFLEVLPPDAYISKFTRSCGQ